MRAFFSTLVCFIAVFNSSVTGKSTNSFQNIGKSALKPIYKKNFEVMDISASTTQINSVSSEDNWRGNACILGGALAHLTFGTMYCWGNFLTYTPDYLRYFNGKLNPGVQPDALYIIPFTIITQAIAMPFGPSVSKVLGNSKTLLLGGWIAALAVYLASFQTELSKFMLFYSLMFGAGIGIAYTAPMAAGWKWKPSSKGLVSGGILAGFGSGGFIFSMIGSRHVNPNHINAIKGRFPTEIYDKFPSMLRKLAVLYAVVATIGAMLVFDKPIENNGGAIGGATTTTPTHSISNNIPSGLDVSTALNTSQFWLMWAMIVASSTAGLNTVAVYKLFAATSSALTGDSYQNWVGGVGAIINGVGRIIWGMILDRIGFKNSFTVLTAMQAIAMLTYPFSVDNKAAFAANTCLLFFCLAGNFALMPPATQKMFGVKNGAVIYGLIFSAFAISSVLGGMLTKSLSLSVGWPGVFKVLSGMSMVALLLVRGLKPVETYPESSV